MGVKKTSGDTQAKWHSAVAEVLKGYDICSWIDANPSKIRIIILTVTALFPVVSWHTVVTLGPRGTFFTLAEARAITSVMNRTHLVAVTLWKKREVEEKDMESF